jgi:DNA-binding NtrC family response regulator
MSFKVFLIEDNQTEGMLLKLALSSNPDLDIEHFTNAKDMFEKITEKPSIALVDINLPDINGLELIQKLKVQLPEIKIIVISAQRDVDMIAQIQEEGVYNYLVKSEGVLAYLKKVIADLLIILKNK